MNNKILVNKLVILKNKNNSRNNNKIYNNQINKQIN